MKASSRPKERSRWQGTETSCQHPCKYVMLAADPTALIKPSDDYSQLSDCNLMKNPEPDLQISCCRIPDPQKLCEIWKFSIKPSLSLCVSLFVSFSCFSNLPLCFQICSFPDIHFPYRDLNEMSKCDSIENLLEFSTVLGIKPKLLNMACMI